MLTRWTTLYDTNSGGPRGGSGSVRNKRHHASIETNEAREGRQRAAYESALSLARIGDSIAARAALRELAQELRPAKRPRRNPINSADEDTSFARALRHAVSRNLGDCALQVGDAEEALEAYAAALDDDAEDFVVCVRAARAAMKLGRLHVARTAFENALRMRPGNWLCERDYQAVLSAIGDCDEDVLKVAGDMEAFGIDDETVKQLLENKIEGRKREDEEQKKEVAELDFIFVDEPRWISVIDALSTELADRLAPLKIGPCTPVGCPVRIEFQREPSRDVVLIATDSDKQQQTPVKEVAMVKIKPDDEARKDVNVENAPKCENETEESKEKPELTEGHEKPATASEKNEQAIAKPHDSSVEIIDLEAEKESSDVTAKNVPRKVTVEGGVQNPKPAESATTPPISDTRRSLRQRGIAEEKESPSAEDDDDGFLDTMLSLCSLVTNQDDNEHESSNFEMKASLPDEGKNSVNGTESAKKESCGTWTAVISEFQEEQDVRSFFAIVNKENSGPLDVLMRVLSEIVSKESIQFSAELARLWLVLRKHAALPSPGSVRACAGVIEALLVSGLKARKAKTKRFEEAQRLLSIVSITLAEESLTGTDGAGLTSEVDHLMISLRCSWLSSLLSERNSKPQDAFMHASHGLDIVKEIAAKGIQMLRAVSGPEFAGCETKAAIEVFENRVRSLKRSSELQKATEEISTAKQGSISSASKALAILAPSIRESVKHLELDRWKAGDLFPSKQKEKGGVSCATSRKKVKERTELLDAEGELEARLHVFAEACTRTDDAIGDLLCFSIRLRLSVHYYCVQLEAEKLERAKRKAHPDPLESAAGKLADLLIQIRKYVAIVKKVSSTPQAKLVSTTLEQSGWSLSDAVLIASHTLIALCEILSKKIPILRITPSKTPLSASQKNQRLAFTRCILAFCRCIELLMKLNGPFPEEIDFTILKPDEKATINLFQARMLVVASFCLRTLASRGCCREEGTGGALIKLYAYYLSVRLQFLVRQQVENESAAENGQLGIDMPDGGNCQTRSSCDHSNAATDMSDDPADTSYNWEDIVNIRQQLAQCYRCLYRLPDLETAQLPPSVLSGRRWLENSCRASSQQGLSFVTGDANPTAPRMQIDTCRNVYFLYRKRIFAAFLAHHRDGYRAKRSREIISEVIDILPDDPPESVPTLPFSVLDDAVSSAVEGDSSDLRICELAINKMRQDWESGPMLRLKENFSSENCVQKLQLNVMYFEAYIFNVLGNLATYEFDYKKCRPVGRRKQPKEVVERLLNASSDCVTALRCRPWSVGAWILLGRIFVELADVALDERELVMSTFGLCRADDLAAGEEGETPQTIMGRAEVCFGFAYALTLSSWPNDAVLQQWKVPAVDIYGEAHDGADDASWCGFGDDGDLFGAYGLSNDTTSRPWFSNEEHPAHSGKMKSRRNQAAIFFGRASLFTLRAREERYWHDHWNVSALDQSKPAKKRKTLPSYAKKLYSEALSNLEKGFQHTFDSDDCASEPFDAKTLWRKDARILERQKWYYLLLQAKLKRKLGFHPREYLQDFASALAENGRLRTSSKLPVDIEPMYQLHAARAKILLDPSLGTSESILGILESHSFSSGETPVPPDGNSVQVSDAVDFDATTRRRGIASDIMKAMKECKGAKNEHMYSEFFYKSSYCRALLYSEVLGQKEQALAEVSTQFRGEAAAKTIESGSDGIHRGYFYMIWNYRYTETGCEPTLESERKLVRWRFKMLSLYSRYLQEFSDRRTLAGIISRLKRRSQEDLPVDGALLDDLILAYADVTRTYILKQVLVQSIVSGSTPDISFKQTWDVFVETLRLAQGVRRGKSFLERGETTGVGPQRLSESKRPWCLVAINNTLHLERLRFIAMSTQTAFNMEYARSLPHKGLPGDCPSEVLEQYADTLRYCGGIWKIDPKLQKLLNRRITRYIQKPVDEQAQQFRGQASVENSVVLDTANNSVALELTPIAQRTS